MISRFLIIIGYRKSVITKNLEKRFFNNNFEKSKVDSIYRQCITNIARIIVESLCSIPTSLIQNKENGIYYENVTQLEKACNSNNGLVLFVSHYGNWELACTLLPKVTDLPIYGVYKPLRNRFFNEKVKAIRSKHGLHLVPLNKIARVIATNKNKSIAAIYILIADQNPNTSNNIIWANFMGISTAYANGAKKIIDKYNFGLAYMNIRPQKKPYHYSITFDFDFDIDNDITQQYSNKLQSQIIKKPQYWLWSHKRWKRKVHK